jgi:hypothetical protein
MWIPKPLYDHAPLFWLLLGALFMAGGLFLGFGEGLKAAYFVFAIFCIGQSVWTFFARRRYRRQAQQGETEEAAEPAES